MQIPRVHACGTRVHFETELSKYGKIQHGERLVARSRSTSPREQSAEIRAIEAPIRAEKKMFGNYNIIIIPAQNR